MRHLFFKYISFCALLIVFPVAFGMDKEKTVSFTVLKKFENLSPHDKNFCSEPANATITKDGNIRYTTGDINALCGLTIADIPVTRAMQGKLWKLLYQYDEGDSVDFVMQTSKGNFQRFEMSYNKKFLRYLINDDKGRDYLSSHLGSASTNSEKQSSSSLSSSSLSSEDEDDCNGHDISEKKDCDGGNGQILIEFQMTVPEGDSSDASLLFTTDNDGNTNIDIQFSLTVDSLKSDHVIRLRDKNLANFIVTAQQAYDGPEHHPRIYFNVFEKNFDIVLPQDSENMRVITKSWLAESSGFLTQAGKPNGKENTLVLVRPLLKKDTIENTQQGYSFIMKSMTLALLVGGVAYCVYKNNAFLMKFFNSVADLTVRRA